MALLRSILRWLLVAALGSILLAACGHMFIVQKASAFQFLSTAVLALAIAFLIRAMPRWLASLPEARFLAGLVALAAGLRLAWVAAMPNGQVSDFAVYHELSAALASGRGYALTGPVGREDLVLYLGANKRLPYTTAHRAPGTALWGMALYELFGVNPLWFKLSNVVLGTATCVLIYLLATKSLSELARPASLLWAVYPTSVFATNLFCSEVLHACFLTLLALLMGHENLRIAPRALLVGGMAAWCSLIRPLWVPLGAGAAAWCARLGWRRGFAASGAFALAMAAGLAPWTFRNWRVFHRFIPICTNEGENFGRHTAAQVPAEVRASAAWKERWERWRATEDEADRSRQGYALGLYNLRAMALAGPVHVLRSLARGIVRFFGHDVAVLAWSDTNAKGLAGNPGPPRLLSRSWFVFWATLTEAFYLAMVAMAVLGAFRLNAAKAWGCAGVSFLLTYFLAAFLLHALVPGINRYHFSLMVPVALLAACAGRAGKHPQAPSKESLPGV